MRYILWVKLISAHHGDVTWAIGRPKSPADHLFISPFGLTTKIKSKLRITGFSWYDFGLLCGAFDGNLRVSDEFPSQKPFMRQVVPCHDVIIQFLTNSRVFAIFCHICGVLTRISNVKSVCAIWQFIYDSYCVWLSVHFDALQQSRIFFYRMLFVYIILFVTKAKFQLLLVQEQYGD